MAAKFKLDFSTVEILYFPSSKNRKRWKIVKDLGLISGDE